MLIASKFKSIGDTECDPDGGLSTHRVWAAGFLSLDREDGECELAYLLAGGLTVGTQETGVSSGWCS